MEKGTDFQLEPPKTDPIKEKIIPFPKPQGEQSPSTEALPPVGDTDFPVKAAREHIEKYGGARRIRWRRLPGSLQHVLENLFRPK